MNRREFLTSAAASVCSPSLGQIPGSRPPMIPPGIRVLNPGNQVPLSFIIDDSTCLVNLAHFAIPQFAEVFPKNYKQDWKKLPREIPDSFVRSFAEWCQAQGIKGKYSVVPFPACVGWIDSDLPGWSKADLLSSLDLIRTHLLDHWDIHPEMVSHTWVINPKTGKPFPERTDRFMENWRWTDGRSADEIGEYIAYALKPLKNVGLPANGITTPGGFGNRALPALAQATLQACRDVFQTEIPHYFRHLFTDDRSVAPRVEYAANLQGPNPECVVSIIGCTGDWFGGWDGLELGSVDLLITEDGRSGRMVEVIRRGEPAIAVCHWPGLYFNGTEKGFHIFQEMVRRLKTHFTHVRWMKLSEISRYWAAKELTHISREGNQLRFQAPFAAPDFTIECDGIAKPGQVVHQYEGKSITLMPVDSREKLRSGCFFWARNRLQMCFSLPKNHSEIQLMVNSGT